MLVKDFIKNSLYRGTNQKLQTVLLWDTAVVNAINFALSDIYTYEGKEWTFMYDKKTLTWDSTTDKNIVLTLDSPIKKVFLVHDKNDNRYPATLYNTNTTMKQNMPSTYDDRFQIIHTEPTEGIENLNSHQLYFKPWSKSITIANNNNQWYVLHYVHGFDFVGIEDTLPIPDMFLWALYNIVMTYLYPINWQYGDNKDANSYNKAKDQLVNLAKSDSFQNQQIIWNVN